MRGLQAVHALGLSMGHRYVEFRAQAFVKTTPYGVISGLVWAKQAIESRRTATQFRPSTNGKCGNTEHDSVHSAAPVSVV